MNSQILRRNLSVLITAIALFQSIAYGGAVRTGFNSSTMARNDDDSVGPIGLGFTISIFGMSVNQIYLNSNGNITFDGPLSTFTPAELSSSQATLAPFWADVDTRSTSSAQITYGGGWVGTNLAFGINWVNVGYYNTHADKTNKFQLVIISKGSSASFDVEYNYDSIKWETGDASGGSSGLGGTSARVGLTDGAGQAIELAGSGVNGALLNSNTGGGLIYNSRNSGGVAGRYIFSWSSGLLQVPTLTVSVPDAEAWENPSYPTNLGKIRITRTGSTSSALTARFATSGAATGPSPSMDYTLYAGGWVTTTATIPASSSYVDVNVYPWWDGYTEDPEDVILTLTPGEYYIGSPSSGSVTIKDH